jgi:hypothetical protein
VRLNRKRLVIVLEDQIYLYDIQTMKLLYTIETSPNPMGKPGVILMSFVWAALTYCIQLYALCLRPPITATLHIPFLKKPQPLPLLHRLMPHLAVHTLCRQQAKSYCSTLSSSKL